MDWKIHHIGYLVKKIEKAIDEFEALGYVRKTEQVYDEYRQIYIIFMEKDGYCIELISPASKDAVVSGLLKKIGNSPYHICYEVESSENPYLELEEANYILCSEPHEAVALENRKVSFWIHPSIGMIEIIEK